MPFDMAYPALCFESVDRPRSVDAPPKAGMTMRTQSLIPLAIFAISVFVFFKFPAGGMALICLCLIVYLRPAVLWAKT